MQLKHLGCRIWGLGLGFRAEGCRVYGFRVYGLVALSVMEKKVETTDRLYYKDY